jgi:hypothetical protein
VTRTVAETDRLLDVVTEARKRAAAANAALLLLQAHNRTLTRRLEDAVTAQRAAEAECAELQAALVAAERQRDEALRYQPSALSTVWDLLRVAVGALAAGATAGAGVATAIVGRWPW